jgi:hypothetical protein
MIAVDKLSPGLWDYEGSYRGHCWDDPVEELCFARSDFEHAYKNLLDAQLTALEVSKAKAEMDQATDRLMRVTSRLAKEIKCTATAKI